VHCAACPALRVSGRDVSIFVSLLSPLVQPTRWLIRRALWRTRTM
jgi:hypothetical protein